MADLHEAQFSWPHTEPSTVIVTGTFDQWSSSIHLVKGPSGFTGSARVPWGEKISFKFIVDGYWTTHEGQPTESDLSGNVNNIYTAPQKPVPEESSKTNGTLAAVSDKVADASKPVADTTDKVVAQAKDTATDVSEATPSTNQVVEQIQSTVADVSEALPSTNQIITQAKDTAAAASATVADLTSQAVARAQEVAGGASESATEAAGHVAAQVQETVAQGKEALPAQTDITNAILATDGTSSALQYVTSGVGAAIHGVIGIDPINAEQIAIPTPKADAEFTIPEIEKAVPEPVVEPIPAPTPAPDVPIGIVPVNAAENNDTPTPAPVTQPDVVETTLAPAELVSTIHETKAVEEPSTHTPVTAPEGPSSPVLLAATLPVSSQLFTAEVSSSSGVEEESTPSTPQPITVEDVPTPAIVEAPQPMTAEVTSAPIPVEAFQSQSAEVITLTPVQEAPQPTTAEVVLPTATPEAPSAQAAAPTDSAVPVADATPATKEATVEGEKAAETGATEKRASPTPTPTPTAPSTPVKKSQHTFPSSDTPGSVNDSPSSSKFSTSSRKKRTSIFGKISLKGIFGHDKDKEKK